METAQVDLGRVVARTFAIMKANAAVLAVLGLVLQLLPWLLLTVSGQGFQMSMTQEVVSSDGSRPVPPNPFALAPWLGVTSLVSLVLNCVFAGAVTHVALADGQAGRSPLGAALKTGVRTCLPLLGMAILAWLGISFGLMLLFVPGLMLMTMWAVAAPARVAEPIGVFAAFGRSRALTKGHRWTIFALLLAGLVVFALLVGLSVNLSLSGAAGNALAQVPGAIGSMVVQVAIGVALAALYAELRAAREGARPEELAAVFA